MRFTIRYKKIIAYLLINHVYAISKSNKKDVINFIYQRQFKLIMLKFLFFRKCYKDFLRIIMIMQMSSIN